MTLRKVLWSCDDHYFCTKQKTIWRSGIFRFLYLYENLLCPLHHLDLHLLVLDPLLGLGGLELVGKLGLSFLFKFETIKYISTILRETIILPLSALRRRRRPSSVRSPSCSWQSQRRSRGGQPCAPPRLWPPWSGGNIIFLSFLLEYVRSKRVFFKNQRRAVQNCAKFSQYNIYFFPPKEEKKSIFGLYVNYYVFYLCVPLCLCLPYPGVSLDLRSASHPKGLQVALIKRKMLKVIRTFGKLLTFPLTRRKKASRFD